MFIKSRDSTDLKIHNDSEKNTAFLAGISVHFQPFVFCKGFKPRFFCRLVVLLRLHQFLGTKTTETNKSLKTDANGAHYKRLLMGRKISVKKEIEM